MRFPKVTKKTGLLIALVLVIALVVAGVVSAEDATATEGGFTFVGTWWAMLPPIIAIVLALLTKEVYLSLFTGILVGALFLANFNPIETILVIFNDGMVSVLADSWDVGILIFTVALGIVSALVYRAGGSSAYGKWAERTIKTRTGAQFITFLLGVLIFVDDYFNCLTVGNVMRPVTDKHQISRAKLAYLVDSTAAPVCIIAPISSWAAAVAGSLEDAGGYNRFQLFTNSIPYNFYALLTLTFITCMIFMKFDFGPMKKHEQNAAKGDLFTTGNEYKDATEEKFNEKGKVIDLILPIVVLVLCCIMGLVYTGGFFDAGSDNFLRIMDSFADCDASMGLVYGVFVALVFMFIYFLLRRVLTMKQYAECLVTGFKNMVPPVLILTFAWTLSAMTGALGLADWVAGIFEGSAAVLQRFLPAIVCLVAMGLSFASGTSWGTFGILLPIVIAVFPFGTGNDNLAFVGIAACLSGAVFGDHCSPISDTTIMSSAGAQSNHINHVSTQAPYALICGGMTVLFFIIAGLWPSPFVTLIGIAAMVGLCFIIKAITKNKKAA